MNVLVEEQCLKDIAESIRRKGGLTTTYKPREMAVAIDNLQTGGSGCLVRIEQSDNQKITVTYKGKTYTNGEFFVLIGESLRVSITADPYYTAGTLNYNGKPLQGDITIKATQARKIPRYCVTIEQSANQTITATCDRKTYTSTFYAYEGSRITFSVQADSNYEAGTLNYTEISSLNSDVTVKATAAVRVTAGKDYKNLTFKIIDGGKSTKYCQFKTGTQETFTLSVYDNQAKVSDNADFVDFLKWKNKVMFEYNGMNICIFAQSNVTSGVIYNMLRNTSIGAEMTVRVG